MLVMNQMPIGKNWKEYLTNVLKIQSSCPYASFKFSKGNVENGQSIYLEGHNLKMYSKDDQGERVVTRYPFIYTETGIKMFSPITIDGVILDELDWDVKQRCFTAANGSNDYAISFYCPPAYKLYPGMYYLVSGTDQFVVSVSSKIEGSTYTLESEDFPPGTVLEAKFNVDTDCFDIEYQYACQYDNYQVYLCPWDSEAGYFTWSLGSGLSGTNVAKEGEMPLIEFTDNGVYGSADSFLFYAFSGTPSSSTAAGTIFRLVQPVLARVF